MPCVGGPQDYPTQFNDSLGDSHIQRISLLMAKYDLLHRKAVKKNQPGEISGAQSKVQRKPGASVLEFSPSEVTQDTLNSSRNEL